MKLNKILLLSFTSLTFSLFSCNNENSVTENNKVSLDEVVTALSKAYDLEVSKSSKVYSSEETTKNYSKEVVQEETNIYNDEVTISNGTRTLTYTDSNKVISDTYLKLATAKTYKESEDATDTYRIFFLITDYNNDGSDASTWVDSAYRLPIYENGKNEEDGLSYLLEKSVPGQLSKQASLYTSNFINSNLINNVDLNASNANIKATKTIDSNKNTLYKLDNFSYNYDEDGINTTMTYSFEVLIDNEGKLINSSYQYITKEARSDSDSYEVSVTNNFKIEYDERISSTTLETQIDPRDYYLESVSEVNAYYFDNGEKIYCELDKLPIEKYIKFEAKTYKPLKAIDLTMNVTGISDETNFEISGETLFTKSYGQTKVTLESETGANFEVDVKVLRPELTKLTFTDVYSGAISGDKNKIIFTNTTYKNLRLNVYPNVVGVDYTDIKVKLSDDSLATITKLSESKGYIDYQLEVKDIKESKDLTITFYSESKPDIKVSVTYTIKIRLTEDELYNKLLNNTYRYESIYSDFSAELTFSSKSNGKIVYTSTTNTLTTEFTYSISNTTFNINITSDDPAFNYNDGEITLDGETITLSVDVTAYIHKFQIVSK